MVGNHGDRIEPAETSRSHSSAAVRLLEEILGFQKATQSSSDPNNWNFWWNSGRDSPRVARWKHQRSGMSTHNSKLFPDGRRKPLTDLFDERDFVKIVTGVPGYDKSEILLDITAKSVEIRAEDSIRAIGLPTTNFEVERAAANYRNGVLEVTIPKRSATQGQEEAIRIE